MGGLTDYLRDMHKEDGLQGRGKATGSMEDTYISGVTDEGHVRIYFGVGKEAAATGIRKAWRGRKGAHHISIVIFHPLVCIGLVTAW